jgi:hypothetical protein
MLRRVSLNPGRPALTDKNEVKMDAGHPEPLGMSTYPRKTNPSFFSGLDLYR